jgi:hypothetical protein
VNCRLLRVAAIYGSKAASGRSIGLRASAPGGFALRLAARSPPPAPAGNAECAALVDVGALGGYAVDDILGGHIAGMPLLPDVPSSIYKLRVKLFQIVHPVALAP